MLSVEQQHILDTVLTGHNVVVDAVAGTGKTTLILAIANAMPGKNILQMTYNKSLKFEVREKIADMALENLTVHTYHSLAVCYYSSTAHVDNELNKIVVGDLATAKPIPPFDIIVLDETQDMTPLYYDFMVKFIKDMGSHIQLLILGDYMQGLYEFKGSDTRFLTMADLLWNAHPALQSSVFDKCTMKMSYRITNQMCSFVNEVMIGADRMNACRNDTPVHYIRNSRHNIERIVCAEINRLFEAGVKPCEIFVLGPSVKGDRSNIRRLENMLVERNIPCYVPMLENTDIDQRVIDGKIVFSTFHSVKGRQRKYVFVVGFDNSYFKYYARNLSREICPNTLYVACTRATNGLYVLESDTRREDRPLEFLHKSHIQMKQVDYLQFRGNHQSLFVKVDEPASNQPIHTTPTDLIKFIPEEAYQQICSILEKIFVVECSAQETIDIPSVIQTKNGFYEEVSDLNGIAIPCMYYDHLMNAWNDIPSNKTKDSVLYDIIDMNIENITEKKQQFLMEIIDKLPDTIDSISDYLYMANINQAIQESLFFKLNQIDKEDYNWISEEIIHLCKQRLRTTVSPDCLFVRPKVEEYIIHASAEEMHAPIDTFVENILPGERFRISARTDLITETTVWELKCTANLTNDHMLQLAIYAWLWNITKRSDKIFRLFNIKSGELMKLEGSMNELNDIMCILLCSRFSEPCIKTDEEFIDRCVSYTRELYRAVQTHGN